MTVPKTTTIHLFSKDEHRTPATRIVRKGETATYRLQPTAAFRPSRLKIFAPEGARLQPLSLHWGQVNVDLSKDSNAFEPDIGKVRGERLYTESTAELTIRNDGSDAEFFPVFYGRAGLGEDEKICSSEMFFSLSKVDVNDRDSSVELKADEHAMFLSQLHFPTRVLRARIRTTAPFGELRIDTFQFCNIDVILGADMPAESLDGMELDSVPLDGCSRVSVGVHRKASKGAPPVRVSVEVEVLARGVFDEKTYFAEKRKRETTSAVPPPSDKSLGDLDTALIETLSDYVTPGMLLSMSEQKNMPGDLTRTLMQRFEHAWKKTKRL
jgi:hypothetical protein